MSKSAIIIGATGLVGTELVKQLFSDATYSSVKIFVRKKLELEHPKLEQCIINFEKFEEVKDHIKGDVVFCCMGTTIKVAGSQDAFFKVDHTYPYYFAQLAKANGIDKFLLVSSLGADKNSSNFYLRVKGQIEWDLERLKFRNLIILRPSMLLGNRKEFRLGELIGKVMMKTLAFVFIGKLKKYRAIEAASVAKAMILLSKNELDSVLIFQNDRLLELGK